MRDAVRQEGRQSRALFVAHADEATRIINGDLRG